MCNPMKIQSKLQKILQLKAFLGRANPIKNEGVSSLIFLLQRTFSEALSLPYCDGIAHFKPEKWLPGLKPFPGLFRAFRHFQLIQ